MEFLTQIQAIGTVFALILLYTLWRRKLNNHKTKGRDEVPTPSGALPISGHLHLIGGQEPPPKTLAVMADKYGPILMLRLGIHRTLVVSSWELVKDCFTTNDRVFATRPQVAAGKYLGYNHAVFAFTPYGSYWRGIRNRTTLNLLSKARLDKLKHVRITIVDISIKELYSIWAKNGGTHPVKVEMEEWFDHLSLNIITEMIAGKRYLGNINTGYEDEAKRLRRVIAQLRYQFGVFVPSDVLPFCEWLDLGGHLKAMKSLAKEFDCILGNWVEEHRRNIAKKLAGEEEGELDFIDVMLTTLSEENLTCSYDDDTIIKATVLA
ncbi:cytochrome P450 CYP82H23-like [Telopea speciosissima]|uniref:cytochrome P450 CYP82H23-like n=1 Tax=Telopea speciosissima TaxID=54955 RepID=UPI001CC39621|nr:cytochrome P450 CYP82H23-like [Telopea speciosissima]